MIGELTFTYASTKTTVKILKLINLPTSFFKKLQQFFAKDIAQGTTKTAMIYGSKE